MNIQYLIEIWNSRYFWIHLAIADIRAKYRRSALGVLWAVLFPLSLTLLLGLVMGTLFKVKIGDYIPYVYTGVIIWDMITGAALAGCTAFINSETYIKQYCHPLVIYPLRVTLSALINFCLAMLGVFLYIIFWQPSNINLSWFTLPISVIMLFYVCWPISIITSFINTRFRDFTQLAVLGLQSIWYISPVFISQEIFQKSKLFFLVDYNPVYHLLNIFRSQFLYGEVPSHISYLYSFLSGVVLWLVAIILVKRKEKKVIFYL